MPGFQSPNYTQTPNDWFDELLPLMGYAEAKVTAVLIRNTFGFHKKRCELSLTALARKTGLSERGVLLGAEAAEARGLIHRITKGGGRRKRTVWEVVVEKATTSTGEVVAEVTTSPSEVVLPHLVRQTTSPARGRINKTKETEKKPLTTSAAVNTSTPVAAAAAVEHGEWWSLSVLISASKLPAKHRKPLAEGNPSPGAFVSKYLYALTKTGFNKPPLWAASQIATNPGAWEGEPYESLAGLGPAGVAEVLAWLRDDGAYPLQLNGATPMALKLRADLKEKFKKEPARLYTAVSDAIADLGLAALVRPDDAAELEEPAPAPQPAPPDAWLDFLKPALRDGQINGPAYDRLIRCRLLSSDGGRYVVSVPDANDYQYVTHRLALFAKNYSVTFQQEA